MKKSFLIVLTLLIFSFSFNVAQVVGQEKKQSFGNIKLKIEELGGVQSQTSNVDVPINFKFPKFTGNEIRVEESHGDSWQINSIAFIDEKDSKQALLKVSLTYNKKSGKTKIIRKEFKLKKGQSKMFRLKHEDAAYKITADY